MPGAPRCHPVPARRPVERARLLFYTGTQRQATQDGGSQGGGSHSPNAGTFACGSVELIDAARAGRTGREAVRCRPHRGEGVGAPVWLGGSAKSRSRCAS
eukprot:scaffold169390_cov31-Tisochrysis_lutea.AAC.2